jgi:hypothetical protein
LRIELSQLPTLGLLKGWIIGGNLVEN